MRKALILIIVLFSAINSFSQTIVNRSGPANTVVDARSGASLNFFLPRYADTTAANASKGIDSSGAMIYAYDTKSFWYRQNSPKKWVQVGIGSGVNIYNSDGILTGDRTLTGDNGAYGMVWDSMALVNFNVFGSPGEKAETNLTSSLASINFASDGLDRENRIIADPSSARLEAVDVSESKTNMFTVDKDSIMAFINGVVKMAIRSDTVNLYGKYKLNNGPLVMQNSASFPSSLAIMKSNNDVVANLHYSNSSKHVTWNIYGTDPGLAFHVDYSPNRLVTPTKLLWGARNYYSGLGDSMVFAFSKWTGPAEMALDPAVNGQLYYWNLTNKFRAYQNGVWRSVAMIGDAVDSMFNNAGGDSLIYTIDARRHALPYPAGGGGSLTTTDNNLSISGSVISTNTVPVALTDGATVTWIVANGINATLTLTGNAHTLAITSPQSGKTYLLQLTQDGTGGWGSFTLPGGGTAVLNPTAGATTILIGYYNGTSYSWSSNYTTNPTWQETLTAGSTLTTNNTIAGGGNNFAFDNIADFQVSDASNARFQLRASKTQLYGPTVTRNLEISDSIRWNGLGQGFDTTAYKVQVINPVTGALAYAPWLYAGAGGGGSSALSAITAATGSNTINNVANAQEWQWNSLAGGTGFKLSASTTAAASNTQSLFNVELSGANSTSSQTTSAVTIANTHTGTTSKNIGATISASGATNNFGARISPALLIGSPTENATDGIIIQSPTNSAADGLRIYANNNSSYTQYGWATITRPGALTIGTSSGAVNITPSTGVYIGSTSGTTALLQIAAGSTSKAPVRLTSGSLTTGGNILAGNIEMLTDKLYFTITTGTAVKEITLNDAPLTSGTVPVATTNGRLTDGLVISAGTITPTSTDANVASKTWKELHYTRVGNTVTFSGTVLVAATAGGAVTMTLNSTSVVTSNFTLTDDVAGVGVDGDNSNTGIYLDANTSATTFVLHFTAANTASHPVYFSGSYRIR